MDRRQLIKSAGAAIAVLGAGSLLSASDKRDIIITQLPDYEGRKVFDVELFVPVFAYSTDTYKYLFDFSKDRIYKFDPKEIHSVRNMYWLSQYETCCKYIYQVRYKEYGFFLPSYSEKTFKTLNFGVQDRCLVFKERFSKK